MPIVAKCAAGGDELAVAVLERAGDELAEQVALVALKMKESGGKGKVGVAYTGGVLEHIGLVRAAMAASLKKSSPAAFQVMDGAVDALEGALWRASDGGKISRVDGRLAAVSRASKSKAASDRG